MNARILFFALSFLFLGCSSSSDPGGGDPIILTTDSSAYTSNAQEVKVLVSLTNYLNNPVYCYFARGQAIMILEGKADTSWFLAGSFPINDISQDSIYIGMIPKDSVYKETLVFTHGGAGTYRISWSGFNTPQGRGYLSRVSNIFKITQ